MSAAQRRRLMILFAKLDWECLILKEIPIWFVTLSLPQAYWESPCVVKPALKRFKERLEYRYRKEGENGEEVGYVGAIVRRELGAKNGCLHFHLVIVGGALEVEDHRVRGYKPRWIAKTWTDCLEAGEYPTTLNRCGVVCVTVERMESAEHCCKYLVKYCSKAAYEGKENDGESSSVDVPNTCRNVPDDAPLSKAHTSGKGEDAHSGWRWWAVWGDKKPNKTLPMGDVISFEGDFAVVMAVRLKRAFRRWQVDIERKRLKKEVCQAFDKKWRHGMRVPSVRVCELEIEKIDKMSVRQLAGGPQIKPRQRRRERKQDEQAAGEGFEVIRKGARLPFGERLRRSQGGFTILMAPKTLERAVDYALDVVAWDGKPVLKGAVTGFRAWARHADTPSESLMGETGLPSESLTGETDPVFERVTGDTSWPRGRGVPRREKVRG